jgi:hypothetical protein
MDDTWIGGPQPGLRGSRQLKGRRAALVLMALEKHGEVSGRVRMAVLPDARRPERSFAKERCRWFRWPIARSATCSSG